LIILSSIKILKQMRNKLIYALTIATMGGLVAVGAYKLLESKEPRTFEEKQKVHFTSLANYAEPADGPLDFTVAAAKTVPAVVHIKVTMSESPQASYFDPFRDFFGDRGPGFPFGQRGPSMSSGSGVIISQDGYIVTNNHRHRPEHGSCPAEDRSNGASLHGIW
jgi:serine protease Do